MYPILNLIYLFNGFRKEYKGKKKPAKNKYDSTRKEKRKKKNNQ